MSAPTPRSCSATPSAWLRPPRPPARPSSGGGGGAEISSGQRAAPGAIERVRIDPATLEPRFKVIGSDLWSDEPGFLEAVESLGITGICGSAIIEVVAEMYSRRPDFRGWRDRWRDGGPEHAHRSHRAYPGPICCTEGKQKLMVTQNDVRAIQLAKAALYAGIRLLMEKQGVETVDTICFAGAFGSFIDPKYAMVLGLIPDCALPEVKAVGNAAGTGAPDGHPEPRISPRDREHG